MSELENISNVMAKNISTYGNKYKEKLRRYSIFHYWKEIAGPVAEDIFPIKIIDSRLILYSQTSAARDNFRYIAKDILDGANEIVGGGEKIFTDIDFAKNFDKPSSATKKFFRKSENKKIAAKKIFTSLADVKLNSSEISECKKNSAEFKKTEIKNLALKSFEILKKVSKLKIKSGWHKCKCCDSLCKPEEIICENCRISERNKMRRKIRRLFYKNPCIKFHDVLNQVKKNFSHISEEISLGVVSTERNFLIKSLAGKIFFDDFNSETLKTLVMIYKQLPREKLTDAVIKKSVKELRFNFLPAENKKFEQK